LKGKVVDALRSCHWSINRFTAAETAMPLRLIRNPSRWACQSAAERRSSSALGGASSS
jgi:hypothetical protein